MKKGKRMGAVLELKLLNFLKLPKIQFKITHLNRLLLIVTVTYYKMLIRIK